MKMRICSGCDWVGPESKCLDFKHPVGEMFCPECHETTEEIDIMLSPCAALRAALADFFETVINKSGLRKLVEKLKKRGGR